MENIIECLNNHGLLPIGLPLLLILKFEFYQYLLLQKKKLEEERNGLRKEVVALRIMQANYEQMVKAQQIPIGHVETRIPDEEKFQMVIIDL